MQRVQVQNAIAVADEGIRRWRDEQVVFAVVSNHAKEQPGPSIPELSSVTTGSQPQMVPVLTTSFNWPALAICETGGNVHMTGSTYSSMYGVLNQAIRENAPPDVAERILNGTASVEEQTAMAIELERKHGIKAWSCWEAAVG